MKIETTRKRYTKRISVDQAVAYASTNTSTVPEDDWIICIRFTTDYDSTETEIKQVFSVRVGNSLYLVRDERSDGREYSLNSEHRLAVVFQTYTQALEAIHQWIENTKSEFWQTTVFLQPKG